MQNWVGPLIAAALLLQVSVLIALFWTTRRPMQKMDRVVTDAADRFRGQLLHIDRIVTGTMEAVEDAGSQFKTTFWRPMQRVSALVQGIKFGLDLLRTRKAAGPAAGREESPEQEEELFI